MVVDTIMVIITYIPTKCTQFGFNQIILFPYGIFLKALEPVRWSMWYPLGQCVEQIIDAMLQFLTFPIALLNDHLNPFLGAKLRDLGPFMSEILV